MKNLIVHVVSQLKHIGLINIYIYIFMFYNSVHCENQKKQSFFQRTIVGLATFFQSYGIGYTHVFTPSNHEPFFHDMFI